MSRGSLYELTDDLITARDEGYISDEELATGRKLIEQALGSINGTSGTWSRGKTEIGIL